jgi:hypothetical protein
MNGAPAVSTMVFCVSADLGLWAKLAHHAVLFCVKPEADGPTAPAVVGLDLAAIFLCSNRSRQPQPRG